MRIAVCLACLLAFIPLGAVGFADESEDSADPFAPPAATAEGDTLPQRIISTVVELFAPQSVPQSAPVPVEEPEETPIDEQATHEQAGLIKLGKANETVQVHAFALDKEGRILAACGDRPGEVRVLDGDGKLLATWKLDIKPEAINIAPDGSVLVAGEGKVFRLSAKGKVVQQADAPHAAALRENKEKLREEAVANLKESLGSVTVQLESFEEMLAELENKSKSEKLNEEEEQFRKLLPDHIKQLKAAQKEQGDQPESEPSDAAIEEQMRSLLEHKLRTSSISADEKHVYLATPALAGYGYEVWRMDPKFSGAKVIVSDLRGCCGHMDVQASSAGIFVAENSRHRVVSYRPTGKQITAWGGRDRTGINGFTSCCNPMNVCFNRAGDVFTAESSTGRIKRFSAQGKFKEFIGDVKLVPGCKNVSIAVSADDERVYMLDITRDHIVLMKRKAPANSDP